MLEGGEQKLRLIPQKSFILSSSDLGIRRILY